VNIKINRPVCVVIPAHNEARTIGGLVRRIRAKGLEVIVVDDGSTDSSGRLAEQEGARVLRRETRQGKGAALKAGFQLALEKDYRGVITMDGDGQHAVDDIEVFLREAEGGAPGVIAGNRFHGRQRMPFVRLLTNRVMSAMISLTIGRWVPDTQCGFRYISTEVLTGVAVVTQSFEIETEILIKAARRGYSIKSVPVQCIYADEVSHIRPGQDAVKFFSFYIRELFRGR
jgi:glycosyltransferase involved in cell wall biosynthesis